MGHPLEQRMDVVRRLARRQIRLFAAARWLACALAIVTTAALIDYWLRFQDHGLRTILAVACWGTIGWFAWRFLRPAMVARLTPLELALRVERYFPILQHRLASALEFLGQSLDDRLAGSEALRRGVVIDAQALSEGLDFTEAIDRRPARRALIGFAAVAALLGMLATADVAFHFRQGRPSSTSLALRRLIMPWGAVEWPRTHHLAVRNAVTKLARGDDFEIQVVDRFGAPLPADTRIEFRTAFGKPDGESDPLQTFAGAMVARRERVEHSFAYRVEGGDDHAFPWTDVTVIPPPEIAKLSVTLYYPEYLGWPAEISPPLIRAWRGTRVELAGRSTAALRAATICFDSGVRLPAALDKDGRGFRLAEDAAQPFLVEASGAYWIELESDEGIRGGLESRYEVRALRDAPPTIAIARPMANLFVTPTANVPLDLIVTDDLAIRDIGLRYVRSDQSDAGHQDVSLYRGPENSPAPRQAGIPTGIERRLAHAWELAPLTLPPGAQLTVFGVAGDYLPQESNSTERRLSVIAPEELLDRLAERQTLILNELARLLRMQYDAQAQVAGVQLEWKHVDEIKAADVERLHGAELTQRQVARGLTASSDGIPAQVAAVLADLEMNRLDHPDTLRQMQDVRETLARLEAGPLKVVEREFTSGVKQVQQSLDHASIPAASVLASSVDGILAAQTSIIADLEALLERLTRWDALRRQIRELAQLRQDQGALAEKTLEIGRQTLARSMRDLAPQERAELERLSRSQGELARRLDNAIQALGQAVEDLPAADDVAAQTIRDALDAARRGAAASEMRSAGESVSENQIAQAAEHQERVIAALDAMLDALTNRQERELSRLVEQLAAAGAELHALSAKQSALAENMTRTARSQESDAVKRAEMKRLATEQQEVAQAADALARRLDRLRSTAGAQRLQDAAAQMRRSEEQARQGAGEAASEQAERAAHSLQEAERLIAEQQAQNVQMLAKQAIDQLQHALQKLSDEQQRVLGETERLEARRLEAGAWTRSELSQLSELAHAQQQLHASTFEAANGLAAARVFRKILESTALTMKLAADRLSERDAGDLAQAAERKAMLRLVQLREALQPTSPAAGNDPPPPENSASPDEKSANASPSSAAVQRLAELKLLKLLQVDVYDATKTLEERRRRQGVLTPAERLELEQLSAEQGDLANMIRELVEETPHPDPEPAAPPPEPSPAL